MTSFLWLDEMARYYRWLDRTTINSEMTRIEWLDLTNWRILLDFKTWYSVLFGFFFSIPDKYAYIVTQIDISMPNKNSIKVLWRILKVLNLYHKKMNYYTGVVWTWLDNLI